MSPFYYLFGQEPRNSLVMQMLPLDTLNKPKLCSGKKYTLT